MHDRTSLGTIQGRRNLPLKVALTLAFAGTAVGLFFAAHAQAATLTVCASGCNHTTIQNAVNAAADGDTVQVAAGTYNETVTLPASRTGLTLTGSDPSNRPLITDGVVFGAGMVNLTLRNLHVRRSGGTTVMNGGSLNGLTMDNVKVQGDNDPCDPAPALPGTGCQHGVAGPQINGAVDVHDSQFVDIRSWSVFDTRSGSGGATQGSDLTTFNFSDNHLSNNGGHVAARGTIGDETTAVTIDGNTVENYPDSPQNNAAAAFKVFYSDSTSFTNNTISNIGSLQTNIGGFPYGAGFMPRNAGNLTITGNRFADSVQGVAFEPRNTTSGGFPDGVIAGGDISGNQFTGNTQGIFLTATNNPTSNLGALAITKNRFVGNDEAVDNDSATALGAENNWWGCNQGPGSPGCDAPTGPADSDPWLVLGLSANPTTIETGGATSQVTADLTRNSNGASVGSGFPNGASVAFATSLGTIETPKATSGGQAVSTLSSGSAAGTANVSATLDNEVANAQVGFVAPPPPPEPEPEPIPNDPGQGTPGADELIGGAEADVLDGGAGDDLLFGAAGNDILDGGDGADEVLGGLGDDVVLGGGGADIVDGGSGNDIVEGGGGADLVDGGSGDDEVHGGKGQDDVEGGRGEDDIHGGAGQDTIDAQDGERDTISCGKNVDEVDADGKDKVASNCEKVV